MTTYLIELNIEAALWVGLIEWVLPLHALGSGALQWDSWRGAAE
jgi:hypothetical protein